METIRILDGIEPIAADYDLFLVDQWGVLHNGAAPHEGALEALRQLRATGKPVVLISNSSKRVSVSERNLAQLGIERDLYDHAVTSGELGWQAMQARQDPFFAELGRRCFMFTWGGDMSFIDGLDLEAVQSMDDAEFLLLAGTSGAPVSTYEEPLQAGARRNLPMVCLNRDMVSVDPEGKLVDCSGKAAARYEALGGTVRYYGKPGGDIYDACLALAPGAERPLAIGDSLHHDIGGANGIGAASVLVTSGIHRFELGDDPAQRPNVGPLMRLAEAYEAKPTFAMAYLAW